MEKLFSKSHEWVKIEGSKAQIGLSDYAQQELGDIVYVNLPELGSDVECGQGFYRHRVGQGRSGEVLSPVCGKVVAVNEELATRPKKSTKLRRSMDCRSGNDRQGRRAYERRAVRRIYQDALIFI